MAAGRPRSTADFLRFLSRGLEGTGDDALLEAREHGQRALESGESLVDLIGALGEALLARLGTDEDPEAAAVVRGGLDIAQAMVVPFQMTVDRYRSGVAGPQEAAATERDFLSRMSHDLRTPLNAILGCAELLDLDELTVSQREAVTDILDAGRHLLMLINELKDGSRPGYQGPAEVEGPPGSARRTRPA